MDLDAVCSENGSSFLCKNVRLDAAVVGNSNGGVLECLVNIIGKTLSSTSYSVNVHSVCACADNASETACTEFEITVESVLYSLIIACNGLKFCLEVRVICCLFTPECIKFLFIHCMVTSL